MANPEDLKRYFNVPATLERYRRLSEAVSDAADFLSFNAIEEFASMVGSISDGDLETAESSLKEFLGITTDLAFVNEYPTAKFSIRSIGSLLHPSIIINISLHEVESIENDSGLDQDADEILTDIIQDLVDGTGAIDEIEITMDEEERDYRIYISWDDIAVDSIDHRVLFRNGKPTEILSYLRTGDKRGAILSNLVYFNYKIARVVMLGDRALFDEFMKSDLMRGRTDSMIMTITLYKAIIRSDYDVIKKLVSSGVPVGKKDNYSRRITQKDKSILKRKGIGDKFFSFKQTTPLGLADALSDDIALGILKRGKR